MRRRVPRFYVLSASDRPSMTQAVMTLRMEKQVRRRVAAASPCARLGHLFGEFAPGVPVELVNERLCQRCAKWIPVVPRRHSPCRCSVQPIPGVQVVPFDAPITLSPGVVMAVDPVPGGSYVVARRMKGVDGQDVVHVEEIGKLPDAEPVRCAFNPACAECQRRAAELGTVALPSSHPDAGSLAERLDALRAHQIPQTAAGLAWAQRESPSTPKNGDTPA